MPYVDITDLVVKGEPVEDDIWEFVFVDGTKRRLKVQNIEGPIYRAIDIKTNEVFEFNTVFGKMFKVVNFELIVPEQNNNNTNKLVSR